MKMCGFSIIMGLEYDGSPIMYPCEVKETDGMPHEGPHSYRWIIAPNEMNIHCDVKVEWEWKKNVETKGN